MADEVIPVDIVPFEPFQKIARWNRHIVITEKIDGTNAQIYVPEDQMQPLQFGSRNRWLNAKQDNHGFHKWATGNAEELRLLGPGRHFGEWYGLGIQRTYGLTHKRFALFNTARWQDSRPPCCDLVPVLYNGLLDSIKIAEALESLRINGSVIVPGFMNPEGIVIYHVASGKPFKITLDNDAVPKGQAQ